MSRDEKIALGVGIGLLLGFMTTPLHRVDPAWVAVLAAGVLSIVVHGGRGGGLIQIAIRSSADLLCESLVSGHSRRSIPHRRA
jgi:hypothetical protein